MKKILDCFDYLKKYHFDAFEVLAIMLELFVYKKYHSDLISKFILKAHKRKPFKDEFISSFKALIGKDIYKELNPNINILKILKALYASELEIEHIEKFLHIISQKKTINKLYFYSTPKEVNDLLVLLLDIKEGQKIYNPCYGVGSIFLSIARLASKSKNISLYGEELDSRLSYIANLIAVLSNIKEHQLLVNDILKKSAFKQDGAFVKFDKILCNPPLYVHMGVGQLKEDERFTKFGIYTKSYPELAFLMHGINHLGSRGAFIVRNQTLQKGFLEEKLRKKLVKDGLIEAVIELPKNIFPHQGADFSILIISKNNKEILHINANKPHFFIKDGKYNQLTNIDEIIRIYKEKKSTIHSSVTKLQDLQDANLRASHYIQEEHICDSYCKLKDFNPLIFRGQRVYGSSKDSSIMYYDIGIIDFSTCGFSQNFSNKKSSGDVCKISKYRLKPYDILLSLRGAFPKVTILGENLNDFIAIANAGIIVIRLSNIKDSLGLYCYLFSKKGFEFLCNLYRQNGENIIHANDLLEIPLPSDFNKNTDFIFKIESLRVEYEMLEKKLDSLRDLRA